MFFEITGEDIASLNDVDLRALVARLCEAEVRRRGYSAAFVTWGGSQTAKDGGLDVRVALPADADCGGFIPRPNTGFQVKKPDMPRSEILDEMRPKGTLRDVIAELASEGGAYVIVSSTGSTSDSALRSRKTAMEDALHGLPSTNQIALDFFDRTRIATWLREHVGLIPWVRALTGRAIGGWQSYGNWAAVPAGVDNSFLLDDQLRIRSASLGSDDKAVVDGIDAIRSELRNPGKVVRLVGLSGVGKTRLAAALFDETIGTDSLDPALAIYTNIADGPDPQPVGLIADLISQQSRAIVIIDNCEPATHRRVVETAHVTGSTVSVLTIEYDVRDDQPEDTDVFKLEAASLDLIKKLIKNRFGNISDIDADTIAHFSGGNARVAIALACTIGRGETIAGLRSEELFERLFYQRNDPDCRLHSIASACSLVYSFEGEALSGDRAEIPVLGELVGKSASDVFEAVAELKERDLVQSRGPWRAVLPHAIANRLAASALKRVPQDKILKTFVDNATERMFKSFSRRLGYLHDSIEAQSIVRLLLSQSVVLVDLAGLDELGRAVLKNIAPVDPEAVLERLEITFGAANDETLPQCVNYARLLRSIAYEAQYFERSISLIIRLANLPAEGGRTNEASDIFESLFWFVLSGTHAPCAMRLRVAEKLLKSANPSEQKLGLQALTEMLKTSLLSSHYEFDFGARSRDYGFHPKTLQDQADWFLAVVRFIEKFTHSDRSIVIAVRKKIPSAFRGLWWFLSIQGELDRIIRSFACEEFWPEMWRAARMTRIYDDDVANENIERLLALEKFLAPRDLVSKVRGVLGLRGSGVDLFDLDEDQAGCRVGGHEKIEHVVEELGRSLAIDGQAFQILLPELTTGDGPVQILGYGIALETQEIAATWAKIVAAIATTKNANHALVVGFLNGVHNKNPDCAEELLDMALENPIFSAIFPLLQIGVPISERGVERLINSLLQGNAPIHLFGMLAYGRASQTISGSDFVRLVLAIASLAGGIGPALNILAMRLFADRTDGLETVPELIGLGKRLLEMFAFSEDHGNLIREDHDLARIVHTCLKGESAGTITRKLVSGMTNAANGHVFDVYHYNDLIKALLEIQPLDVFDELFSPEQKIDHSLQFLDAFEIRKTSIMTSVPDEIILEWCALDPTYRCGLMANVVPLFKPSQEGEPLVWTDLWHRLFQQAADPSEIFMCLIRRMYPTSWSGSLASILERRLPMLDALDLRGDEKLEKARDEAKENWARSIAEARRREAQLDRAESERFE
jgi:hypothetical protein